MLPGDGTADAIRPWPWAHILDLFEQDIFPWPKVKEDVPVPLPALTSFPNLEQLRSKVTELRLRRTDLLQKFNEGAEPVDRVDREIGQIETTLRQAIALQFAERKAVTNSIEQRLQSLNASELGLEVIERDRTVINQNYQTYS